MSIVDYPYYQNLIHKQTIALGNLYFFKKFVVCEFKEGVNIDFDNFNEAKTAIEKQFGSSYFGFVANRIHSYSILITDAPLFNEAFKNLKAYATITYSSFSSQVFEIENHFFNFNRQKFNELDAAIHWVTQHLEETATGF
ncbi:hypothetical protein ES692_10125 [Psychroserpens burtonensis]|uniref:STAS/SEC14 domain-containing protein n=1 Tax=Psychroserpens burtonensis TaxID=49278 RepID=A0A5C7B9M9_9FLAO|nr:hypothetical protein [Psychroserpens burtonensis]TXE17330.1 hypothetical protein ES692_10125 [Psychroserpens burtonensis]